MRDRLAVAAATVLVAACSPEWAAEAGGARVVVTAAGTDADRSWPALSHSRLHVRCRTTAGDFELEVRPDWSRHGAKRYLDLVHSGFWTNITFFRMNKWIVQFGADQKSREGPWQAFRDKRIPDDPHCRPNTDGTDCVCGVPPSQGILFDGALSYAGGGKDSRTSQIFIVHNLADQPIGKDSEWEVPFGNITRGLEIVRALYPDYGERVDQQKIFAEGDAYLNKHWPLLDRIIECTEFDPDAEALARADEESARRRARSVRGAIPPWWAAAVAAILLLIGATKPRRWNSVRRLLC
mmetsp:Transcript_27503/g.72285  ORF Transcript_27503/g.72285 Transcript_27503/m.72285 type:complete len:295 (-) Transcript_27503:3189-4073(-)